MLNFLHWWPHDNDGSLSAVGTMPANPSRTEAILPVGISPCAGIQGQRFDKRIERVGERVYSAIGYALSNVTMIAVNGGKIIVDTTESVAAAQEIKAEFDRLVPGPVQMIVYTHSHPDHIFGTSVFHEPGVPIWAHERFVDELRTQMGMLSRTLRYRSSKQFGDCLPPDQVSSTGIGPGLRMDAGSVPPVLFPTHSFGDMAKMTVGGVDLEFHAAPGETRDHLFVHLPRERTILAGDNFYRAFPNLYAVRGVAPRPVRDWSHSLDHMRWLQPEYLALGHTEPLCGRELIFETMTVYRDAIAYLLAAVTRSTNTGLTPDEMVRTIRLPEHLRTHPFLEESYGKLEWAVRGIYEGYLGWFDGNATNLQRLAPTDRATRLLGLIGHPARIEEAVSAALRQGDAQWAAELCDLLLDARVSMEQAKLWKALALEQLADRDSNPVARNYYRSTALELRGASIAPRRAPVGEETLKDVPVELLMQSFPLRLRPDRSADLMLRIGFEFVDSGKRFTFYIRHGVGEVRPNALDDPDFTISATESDFKRLGSGALPAARASLLGSVRCSGGIRKLRFLRSLLDPP